MFEDKKLREKMRGAENLKNNNLPPCGLNVEFINSRKQKTLLAEKTTEDWTYSFKKAIEYKTHHDRGIMANNGGRQGGGGGGQSNMNEHVEFTVKVRCQNLQFHDSDVWLESKTAFILCD
jgi:hypothetical protein